MHLFQDCVPSEPIFVQRPGGTDEDDGIILSTVINLLPDQPIFLVILDAKTFTEIARAEVWFFNLMGKCILHCCFRSGTGRAIRCPKPGVGKSFGAGGTFRRLR